MKIVEKCADSYSTGKELPLLSDYLRYLPEGQRLFAMNLLTPVEFSIAMLACRDWTNKCQFSENRR